MNDIAIELDSLEFVGGETVTGTVILQLEQDTPLRGIRLKFHGYEKSIWREGGGRSRHTHSETHTFFDEELTLFGHPRLPLAELVADSFKAVFSKENYEFLHPGSYRYPFSYALPPELPADYDSSMTDSRIYYGLKAQVDLPLKFDLEAVQPLVVHESSNASVAHEVTEHKTKKFLFDSGSSMEAAIHLDKDTLCLGETLSCRLEVINRAPRKEIRAVTLALLQIETLCAGGHTHKQQTEITRVNFEDLRFPVKDRTAVDLNLDIPGDLYPTISRATLVRLDYQVQVTLDIPWAVDMKLSMPVVLVNAPERNRS